MKEKLIYIADEDTLKNAIREVLSENSEVKTEFKEDNLSINAAAKFANMSIPTFNKRVKEGKFKRYGSGRKIFFLKSELIEALKQE